VEESIQLQVGERAGTASIERGLLTDQQQLAPAHKCDAGRVSCTH